MNMMSRLRLVTMMACCLGLAACASQQPAGPGARVAAPAPLAPAPAEPPGPVAAEAAGTAPPEVAREPQPYIKKGSGVFLNTRAARSGESTGKGDIVLNFEAVSLREVLKVIFEEILKENYLIDDQVQGVVTIHTSHPVSAHDVVPILETFLQMNGAALVRDGPVYKVVPLAALKEFPLSPRVGRSIGPVRAGQGVQIVPMRYVAAAEMKKILESFSSPNEQIVADADRNLLILSGSSQKIANLLATIEMFDVDWLGGMSFGLIPVKFTDAKTLTEEVETLLGQGEASPLKGVIRLVPIQRLSAVLVISPQPNYIDYVSALIKQFDQGSDKSPDRRLFVYHLKNGKAENIASILQNIFGNQVAGVSARSGPGTDDPLSRGNVRSPVASGISVPTSNADGQSVLARNEPPAPVAPAPAPAGPAVAADPANPPATIMADPDNNAILMMATPMDYNKIKSTIERLDVAPKQVLIEATIAEVVLNDNLSYGVRWFFEGYKSGVPKYQGGLGVPLPTEVAGDGFALGIFNSAGEMRAFFDILETASSVKFLSAPQIMVVDNQTATFRVGDQIPVVTRSSQSTADPNAPIVAEVQYRDTGTLLKVTPRINDGGMVTLEVSQEVSTPGATPAVGGAGNVAISQRTIESTVIVHNGQTIVLGGLFRENTSNSKGGIPGLMEIPVVGNLFSNTTRDINRTELIITLTPKVVRNPREAQEISQELRERISEAAMFMDETNQRRAAGAAAGMAVRAHE
jgi:general secretion pathway protein D